MDFDEYRKRGKELVDYIATYLETIRTRRVFPDVSPGYMTPLVPESAPYEGEQWEDIFSDVERVIMPGITHWQSPYMHAYFPALNSCPSMLGDMLADAIGCLGFTWASSPACTELETIVMDWLGKMIGLPSEFLHSNEKTMGGGVIQTTASESTFVSVLAARSETIKRYKLDEPHLDDADINTRLVGYCSDQTHSSVEKAGLIGLVRMKILPSDDKLSLRGDTLRDAIKKDRKAGYIPFYLCATLGTTGACAFDSLKELGPICQEEEMWMHIDAAYAGTAFICPEFRHFLDGVEYANSIAFNPSKWMMVHFDCTAMWVKDSGALHRTFNVNPLYLRHENTGAAIDYMHWQIPLSKRFRALKLWFVIRSFGVKGLQEHVRKGVRLAQLFESFVREDDNFEIPAERHLGMVVFRLKGDNDLTEQLLKKLNSSGKVHMVPASLKGKYVMRFTVTSQYTTEADLKRDWMIIRDMVHRVLIANDSGVSVDEEEEVAVNDIKESIPEKRPISNAGQSRREVMKKRNEFGMSLILSNVPMSPKFINGSFAALIDASEIIGEYAQYLERGSIDLNGRPIRLLSPRKRLRDQCKNQRLSFDAGSLSPGACDLAGVASFRQGSLDSKIDEIFDCVDQSDPEDLRSNYSGDSPDNSSQDDDRVPASTTSNGQERVLAKKPQQKQTGDYLTVPRRQGALQEKISAKVGPANGIHKVVCKHCGHPVEG